MGWKHFLRGAASVIDIFGTLKRAEIESILARSDADAMRLDLETVGSDIIEVLKLYPNDVPPKQVALVQSRDLTPDEIRRGLELESIARQCLNKGNRNE
jgi:hypothetical protein